MSNGAVAEFPPATVPLQFHISQLILFSVFLMLSFHVVRLMWAADMLVTTVPLLVCKVANI